MKVVIEKSWNLKRWQNVMELWDLLWNFTNFGPEFNKMCAFFADIKTFGISLESLTFLTFSTKMSLHRVMVMENHETVMEKSW